MNIRAFIAAIEYNYQVPAFVKASNNPRLHGVLEGLVEVRNASSRNIDLKNVLISLVVLHGRKRMDGNAQMYESSLTPVRIFADMIIDKVYGFLEVVAKTGRSETNGNAGQGDTNGRPWEEVRK
jgi:hypothetical protein